MAARREKTGVRATSEPMKQVRGTQLVANVLDTTLVELGRVGYEKLSVERVAERARVNKVTIYRRWPTKRDLAQAALESLAGTQPTPEDSGSIRQDLVALLSALRECTDSPTGRALFRVLFRGSPCDDLAQIAETISREKAEREKTIYSRAVARGELPPDVNVDVVHAMLVSAIHNASLFENKRLGERDIEYIVDVVLAGIEGMGSRPHGKRQEPSGSAP
ncbi:TetR/AcrR family transcriptional regulator [Streptomyces sp. NPDC101234]|uniref:TetR/AcrR family transcriptional regulator n=1 Tax=Streptomyces sp. NPDC101234 TaxID=3366138 RepID=UPI0037FBB4EE